MFVSPRNFINVKLRSVTSTSKCFLVNKLWRYYSVSMYRDINLYKYYITLKNCLFYYIMILFKQFYWLSYCHLTFHKIWYCLIKTRIDLVSLSFSFNVIKQLQSFVSVNTSFYGLKQYSPQPKGFGEYRF